MPTSDHSMMSSKGWPGRGSMVSIRLAQLGVAAPLSRMRGRSVATFDLNGDPRGTITNRLTTASDQVADVAVEVRQLKGPQPRHRVIHWRAVKGRRRPRRLRWTTV